jgi:hypothetical protein
MLFLLCTWCGLFVVSCKGSPHLRIIGGKPDPFISFHAKGSVRVSGFSSLCSASFISPVHVVTSGYCVFDKMNGLLHVPSRLGLGRQEQTSRALALLESARLFTRPL